MRVRFLPEIIILFALTLALAACNTNSPFRQKDNVYKVTLSGIRLGDGVPLDLDLFMRWKIEDANTFFSQFPNVDSFSLLVLYPRAMELSGTVAYRYASVDSVFAGQRELFLADVKNVLRSKLGEKGITLKEVAISRLGFPQSYTAAMEAVGMKRQHIEGIRNQNEVDLEQATASKKKADANAQVAIAEAEANARLANIEAKTELARRNSELARAETASQISRKYAQAQADSVRLLNKADIERLADLKNLDVQKRRDLDDLDVDKKRKEKKSDLEGQLELAEVVQNNPGFAAFLINRELASKVDIAVLPTGADASMLGGFWSQQKKEVEKKD